jgi:hypothetical protein
VADLQQRLEQGQLVERGSVVMEMIGGWSGDLDESTYFWVANPVRR